MATKRPHRTAGVTLVELLITVVIGVAILGLTFTIVMANRNLMTIDQVGTELNQNLRIGADIIGDDIRVTGQGILIANTDRMPLKIENGELTLRNHVREELIPGTGFLIDVVYERRYWLDNNILWLRVSRSIDDGATFVDGPNQGVINKVQAMNLRALLRNGNSSSTLTDPGDWRNLRAVEVQLIGATDIRGETHTSELTSSFFPRNVLSR